MERDTTEIEAAVAQVVLAGRGDAVVAADRDGSIVFWNPGAERVFGFSAADAVGSSLDIIIPERLRARHWDGYRRVIRFFRRPRMPFGSSGAVWMRRQASS